MNALLKSTTFTRVLCSYDPHYLVFSQCLFTSPNQVSRVFPSRLTFHTFKYTMYSAMLNNILVVDIFRGITETSRLNTCNENL